MFGRIKTWEFHGFCSCWRSRACCCRGRPVYLSVEHSSTKLNASAHFLVQRCLAEACIFVRNQSVPNNTPEEKQNSTSVWPLLRWGWGRAAPLHSPAVRLGETWKYARGQLLAVGWKYLGKSCGGFCSAASRRTLGYQGEQDSGDRRVVTISLLASLKLMCKQHRWDKWGRRNPAYISCRATKQKHSLWSRTVTKRHFNLCHNSCFGQNSRLCWSCLV